VFAFVKDEGTNLVIMATTLHSIINCEPMKIFRVYEGTCFGHVMSNAYQYATNNDNVFVGLEHVSVKDAQVSLLKTITLTKKFGRRRHEWEWACVESGM
jgi:hypothetical protein